MDDAIIIRTIMLIIGGLIVAGLVSLIKMRRLYLLRPRKFIYSNLSEPGQIIELTVLNYSLKTEDNIEIHLNPNFGYRLIAYNSGDVTINDSTIKIPRLSPEDELTVIILTDGNGHEFTDSDIVSASSKEIKAKVIEKIEELLPPTKKTAQFVAGFVALLALIMGFAWFVTHSVGSLTTKSEKLGEIYPGWEISSYYIDSKFSEYYKNGELPARFVVKERKGKIAIVEVEYINNTDSLVEYYTNFSGPGISIQYDMVEILPKHTRKSSRRKLRLPIADEKIDLAIKFTTKHKATVYTFTRMVSIQ